LYYAIPISPSQGSLQALAVGSCEYNILSILFVWGELYGLAFFRMDVSISRHGLEGEWVFLRHGVPYGSMSSNQIWDKPIGETDTAPTSKPKA
jgi:hypothetical protein